LFGNVFRRSPIVVSAQEASAEDCDEVAPREYFRMVASLDG